jgi:hypothetical protein
LTIVRGSVPKWDACLHMRLPWVNMEVSQTMGIT